jgi:hypothetical protein
LRCDCSRSQFGIPLATLESMTRCIWLTFVAANGFRGVASGSARLRFCGCIPRGMVLYSRAAFIEMQQTHKIHSRRARTSCFSPDLRTELNFHRDYCITIQARGRNQRDQNIWHSTRDSMQRTRKFVESIKEPRTQLVRTREFATSAFETSFCV